MEFLNNELLLKFKSVVSKAKKYMRITKRKTMKSDDVLLALKENNFSNVIFYFYLSDFLV